MVTQTSIPGHVLFLWLTLIAMLGVFMAIPMKRQMINQEGLKFPSGIAAAETLRGLYPEEAAKLDIVERHFADERNQNISLVFNGKPDVRVVGFYIAANAAKDVKLPDSVKTGLP